MVLVLVFTLVLAGWAGLRASQRPEQGSSGGSSAPDGVAAAAGGNGAAVVAPHHHDLGGSSIIGATGALAGAEGEGAAQFGGHSHGAAGPTSDLEARETVAMLAAARRATAPFRDVEVARSHGYRQVTQFIPSLGLHLANLKLLRAGFDPIHPPVLLYEPTPSGRLELVGVAYSVPQQGTEAPAGFPGGEDVWHFHRNLCFLPRGDVTIAPDASACHAKRGVFQARTAWLLHAWIWKANPNGVFTEANPLVF
jgi:hypothetical protein